MSDGAHDARAVDVVGLVGGWAYGPGADAALAAATVVVGAPRHLAAVARRGLAPGAATVPLVGPLDAVLDDLAAHRARGERVCVLASGDPGLFGIVRALGARLGPDALAVHPAPSSVALAFAAVGAPWDDAVVASAHGRPLGAAVRAVRGAPTAAVLTGPDHPPEALGAALLADAGAQLAAAGDRPVVVASRLGEDDAAVVRTDLRGLAAGAFDPLSVVLLLPGPVPPSSLAWGRPEAAFAHRDGMITKAEVRAVVLGRLALPTRGVLWDVGAGSGSVAVEAAALAPGLAVHAVERDADQVARIRANATAHGVVVHVVAGTAPAALSALPAPDRVVVGGGGPVVLEACLARLRPGGRVVATHALLDRAVAAHARLGHLVQVAVACGVAVGDLGVRLDAQNPVFVSWGPSADPG